MAKYTDGPWLQRLIPGRLFELLDASGMPLMRVRGGMMPTVHDARLMAAAPELLQALEDVCAGARGDSPDMWARAYAVIAKAKGE